MFDQAKWVWMDGEMVPWFGATVHVSTHALHYGTGVFEGIRCYQTAKGATVFRLDAHLERFYASAQVYGLKIPFTTTQLVDAVVEVIQRNQFRSCYIRPICYYGSHNLGLIPDSCPVQVSIMAWPWGPYHGTRALEKGVNLTVSPWRKFHTTMMPTSAKACGQYLNSILALRAAVGSGFDEALLLNADGSISECSGENLFVVHGKMLITNDKDHSILMGVTRDSVITIARDLGLPVEVRRLSLADLLAADEAFLTGTAAEVTPVSSVDTKPVGMGGRGPVTEVIQRTFFTIVSGCNASYQHWLHPVAIGSEYVSDAGVCPDGLD